MLPSRWTATTGTLRELARLRDGGARIIGLVPFAPATMRDLEQHDDWERWVARLFPGPAPGVVTPEILGAELRRAGAVPDLEIMGPDATADVRFTHRRSGGEDVYFVTNQSGRSINVDLGFRISGRIPELWDPVSGRMTEALSYVVESAITRVGVTFASADSAFVVFRRPLPARWAVQVT